jgi:hypothetical protein
MAGASGQPSWLVLEELLERGDASFVDELRRLDDAERLGAYAARWFADRRPQARRFLLDYLNRPLNAFRHEPLVKRLFKLAEKAEDDEVMAHFLVLFDRSVRRVKGRWMGEKPHVPHRTSMPRGKQLFARNPRTGDPIALWDILLGLETPRLSPGEELVVSKSVRERLLRYRLFSVHTRNYLRRRAWRYFRRLGRKQPERYVPAIVRALKLYEDADVADGLALLDNWGLMHALFHHCPALTAEPHGWTLARNHKLSELTPAPIFEKLWQAAPLALVELLKEARSRPVRQWAIRLIRRDGAAILRKLVLVELLGLLAHSDEEVVALAAEALEEMPGLDQVSLDLWFALLKTENLTALAAICALMAKHVPPAKVTLEQAIAMAMSRPSPVAKLGLAWLEQRQPASEAECQALLRLIDAPADPVRPELVRHVRKLLGASPWFSEEWVLEYLDCRHADVRVEGWAWVQVEPRAKDSVALWRKLLESPYDDVRLRLVAELERRVRAGDVRLAELQALDAEHVRLLWASVLLNIHRGGRTKPVVVQQLVRRLAAHPGESAVLLPILAVALRSVRGPEWRAGLAGVVHYANQHPEQEAALHTAFPELRLQV